MPRRPFALLSPTVVMFVLALSPSAQAADDHAPAVAAAAPGPAAKSAKAVPAKAAKAAVAAKDDAESLQKLREKLAEKLGAAKAPDQRNPNLVRVVSRPAGEHAAPTAATANLVAKPSAKAMAAAHMATKPNAALAAIHVPHWSYSGDAGPKAWGGLKPEFSACAVGTRQSPIDIRGGISVELEPVKFDYRASNFRVIDNGHTVQVNIDPGNTIVTGGRRFELLQFHFHRPAEERIDGRSFDMVAHLVHKDSDGRLAVVAVLLDKGSVQPLLQTVWNNLPLEKNEEVSAGVQLDMNHLLPADRGYYTYMGSLTTPPCSEGVLWMVMRQPVTASAEQIAIFSRMYPMNARPVQQASGRMIKQSN